MRLAYVSRALCVLVCAPAVARAQDATPSLASAQPPPVLDVTVLGRRPPPSRGASDFQLRVEELGEVPRANASDLLKLAPGILLTNLSVGQMAHRRAILAVLGSHCGDLTAAICCAARGHSGQVQVEPRGPLSFGGGVDRGQGSDPEAAARARQASGAPRQVGQGAAGGAAADVRSGPRPVASHGLRQQPPDETAARRGRAR